MLDIKSLQESIHKHTVKSIEPIQLIKMRIQAELKEEMTEVTRETLQADMRRCDAIIDQLLCLGIMQEFYPASKSLFHG